MSNVKSDLKPSRQKKVPGGFRCTLGRAHTRERERERERESERERASEPADSTETGNGLKPKARPKTLNPKSGRTLVLASSDEIRKAVEHRRLLHISLV